MQTAFSALTRALNTHDRINKTAFDFGVSRKLSPDEIHTIASLTKGQASSVADIAQALGAEPEYAQNIVTTLSKEGLLAPAKEQDHIELTESGITAHNNHIGFHIERDKHFLAYIASLDEDAFTLFSQTCLEMEKWMDSYFE